MVTLMSKNVFTAVILQLVLLLNNVNESQGDWFLGPILGPIFGFPPPQSPPPFNPTPSPAPPTKPFRPSGLKAGFYAGLCPNNVNIEAVIKARVQDEFRRNPSILAAYLRMMFHDCFVNGCDASILIDGSSSEKTSDANQSVRGYEFIDTLKTLAETQCPGLVSCADLIAIITTEVLKLGGGPDYAVETGRCDGLRSNVNDVDLPGPSLTAQQSIDVFAAKNLSPEEMVVLLGAHTVGIAHCVFFQGRLYPGTSQFDADMDPSLRKDLIAKCPQGMTSNSSANLDQDPTSSNKVDNSYYNQIKKQRGLLHVDNALASDPLTSGFVTNLAQSPSSFNSKLANAMLKMQAIGVLTGNQGEIRRNCRRFN